MKRVAFQGEHGAFSELAIQQHFREAHPLPCRELADAVDMLLNGNADYAVLPLENSIAGPVPRMTDVLRDPRLIVISELWLPIHQCLLAVDGAQLSTIQSVLSHPVALAQCTRLFQQQPQLAPVSWYDTAGAARHVAHSGDITLAAIASRAAAEHYDLMILLQGVEDRPDNRTRFAVLARADDSRQ